MEDTLEIISIIVAIIISLYGLFKSSSERNKLKAETLKLYNDSLDASAIREKELKKQIDKLEHTVKNLKETIEKKDERIEELQTLSQKQELEIKQLRTELDSLKSKK